MPNAHAFIQSIWMCKKHIAWQIMHMHGMTSCLVIINQYNNLGKVMIADKIKCWSLISYSNTFSTSSSFFLFSLNNFLKSPLGPFLLFLVCVTSGYMTFSLIRIWRNIPTKSSSIWWWSVTDVSIYFASCWWAIFLPSVKIRGNIR